MLKVRSASLLRTCAAAGSLSFLLFCECPPHWPLRPGALGPRCSGWCCGCRWWAPGSSTTGSASRESFPGARVPLAVSFSPALSLQQGFPCQGAALLASSGLSFLPACERVRTKAQRETQSRRAVGLFLTFRRTCTAGLPPETQREPQS